MTNALHSISASATTIKTITPSPEHPLSGLFACPFYSSLVLIHNPALSSIAGLMLESAPVLLHASPAAALSTGHHRQARRQPSPQRCHQPVFNRVGLSASAGLR